MAAPLHHQRVKSVFTPQGEALIGRHIVSTSPVDARSVAFNVRQLPLSLILLITSFLDAPADISRVCRSSKVLYYLTLPRLYENVVIRSHPEVRYRDGRVEGLGAGSPFSMALDGLISGKASGFVRSIKLLGTWKEIDMDLFAKGVIPDNTMLLNIVVKAALEKMDKLRAFSWELNSKPLKTIYKGLAARTSLTSLTLKFSSSRIPRPTVLIPAMPGLTYLALMNLDPLCYPDDISLLLQNCLKLEELKIEWSPRMRREKEPSVSLATYFGRCVSAKVKLPVKRLSMKNLFARNNYELDESLNPDYIECATIINCVEPENICTVFNDDSWLLHHRRTDTYANFKMLRVDNFSERYVLPLAEFGHFEEIYMINRPPDKATPTPSATEENVSPDNATSATVETAQDSPKSVATPASSSAQVASASHFLASIISRHGPTLKKLLLADRWCLGRGVIITLLNGCPNIEQLGLALDSNNVELLNDIIPLAPKLKALRILIRPDVGVVYDAIASARSEAHIKALATQAAKSEYERLRWIGIGPRFFELRQFVQIPKSDGSGELVQRRVVHEVSWDVIKEVEIFGMDTLEI